ncbi:hypothetical protein LUZ63_020714 [Rhynchospora breviuscula]|uniref:Response regulatory domain-containing protein n=1 Tax=Rhynchospora breviuscula TaxID=2022672 RepID=A0A9P9Z868_9POAL|nr:hypothetical protein LUZ63_020714 [Rhynchospora breviuscula]
MHLPDGHGLVLLRRLRAAGHDVDVIAVTSARDSDVVRSAVAQGVVMYLLKPFTFASFAEKLRQYAEYRSRLAGEGGQVAQDEVDRAFGALRPAGGQVTPKGMSPETMEQVLDAVRRSPSPLSATEVAEATGVSRVTARRYLEQLTEHGLLSRSARYGGSGRPELEYRQV